MTTGSRSPSPVPPPRKAPVKIVRPSKESMASAPKLEQPVVKANSQTVPVKIIRPAKEPVTSTSKLKKPVIKATSQTTPQPKAKAQKSAPPKLTPLNSSTNPLKQSAPTQPLPSPPTAISSPPLPPSPFVPSDLYISMMSGLAMANMPQTMQVAAAADPMAAFQLAQMCLVPPSTFSLPPFPFIPPQPDPVTTRPQLHAPKLPPKPVSGSTPKSNSTPTSTSASYPPVTVEMDPLVLKQKRQARKNNIGWIPAPGFPDRGTFNLVPTSGYLHWSSSGDVTQPDPQRSLVMEDLPLNCRTTEFVRSWSDPFSAIAVHLNGGGKALIEFPSREVAEEAYDSPRLRDGLYERATHVRVFWYRQQVEGVDPSTPSTKGNTGAAGEVKDVPIALTPADVTVPPEEPVSMVTDDPTPLAETSQLGKKAQSRGMGKGSSLPPPERDVPDIDLPVRSSTAPTFTLGPESPCAIISFTDADQEEQRRRSNLVGRTGDGSGEGSERTPSRPPTSPSPSSSSCTKTPPSRLRTPSPEAIQQERISTGSPPSLRYPSTTPEMTNSEGRVPSPSDEKSACENPSTTFTSGPSVIGDAFLEQQLRMRLLAMKRTRTTNGRSDQSSSISTTVVDPGDTLFKVSSPPPISQTPDGIAVSESLELLATSFISDTLQAAQGLPSEPEKFDAAMTARLTRKRGSGDAFGSSADISFKRQRLAQQIEESKRIMERWKAAKTKDERNRIYVLWEESNRFVSLTCADCALISLHNLPLTTIFRSVELLSKPPPAPFQWPCYAERCLIIDSDDEEDLMDSS